MNGDAWGEENGRVWTGGCQCGEVRYEVDSERVLTLICCHCRECQRQASSAFGMSLIMPREAFRLLRGQLKTWQRTVGVSDFVRGNFCPTCGVRIFHDYNLSTVISVKAGSLDDTRVLRPAGHIWTKRAQPWLHLAEDLLHYEGEPDSDEPLYAAYRRA